MSMIQNKKQIKVSSDKDTVFVLTDSQWEEKSKFKLETSQKFNEIDGGARRPDGSINWNCACIGSILGGPCGYLYRKSFECFFSDMYNPNDKETDCIKRHNKFRNCSSKYKNVYKSFEND
ncbi:Coiled-coil-helix-coiled-coil-helix domain-containing protein 4 [Intoshia linei]|uniref:Coiled-coil-helix-coiled-coil-helix domain-containing protein 4 n=1 Tax=Intoshia linei TaxID=1819745 RepID=A0A177AZ10_9BILA|nr:Coiled-coil-helix-coiled-coil-helix domain-containing protein 4 [Intoshia linei]